MSMRRMTIAIALLVLSLGGCSLTGHDASESPKAPTSMIHADDTAWATDVWLPGSVFDEAWLLAISSEGDALVEFTDDASSWADGVDDGEWGLATVTRTGDVTRLVEPGADLLKGFVVWDGQLSSSTVAVGLIPRDDDSSSGTLVLIDRTEGKVSIVSPTITKGLAAGEETSPSPVVLVGDTALWAQITSLSVGTVVAANTQGEVWTATGSEWNVNGPQPSILRIGHDNCSSDGALWIYAAKGGDDGSSVVATAHLSESGELDIDTDTALTIKRADDPSFTWRFLTRCGQTVIGTRPGSADEVTGAYPYVSFTLDGQGPVDIGESTRGMSAPYANDDWLWLPSENAFSVSGLIAVHRTTGERIIVSKPGGDECLLGGYLSGDYATWPIPNPDKVGKVVMAAQCDTYVGRLRSP